MERPAECTDEMLEWLDDLRDTASINMVLARGPLMVEFPELSYIEAGEVCAYWRASFKERHDGQRQQDRVD